MCVAYKRLSIFCSACCSPVLCIDLMQARQQQQFGKEKQDLEARKKGAEGRQATTLMDTQLRNAESAFACSRCQSVPQFVSHHSLPSIQPSVHPSIYPSFRPSLFRCVGECVMGGTWLAFITCQYLKIRGPHAAFHFISLGSVQFGLVFHLVFRLAPDPLLTCTALKYKMINCHFDCGPWCGLQSTAQPPPALSSPSFDPEALQQRNELNS